MIKLTSNQKNIPVFIDPVEGEPGIQYVDFNYHEYDSEVIISGSTLETPDYDDNVGVQMLPSDDGSEWFNSFVVLPENRVEEVGELDMGVLINEVTSLALTPLMNLFATDALDAEDLAYARLLCRNPASIVSLYLETDGTAAEISKKITKIFGL